MRKVVAVLVCCVIMGNTMPVSGAINVIDFGAAADSTTDNTQAFNNALQEAGKTGDAVYVPPGQYRFDGSIVIPPAVTLKGSWEGQHWPDDGKGSTLLIFGGRDKESGEPFATLNQNSTIRGLSLYYPEQRANDIHPYPWTIAVRGARANMLDLRISNTYNGIDCGTVYGTAHHMRNIDMAAARRGVYIDRCSDIGRVENVHIHPASWVYQKDGGTYLDLKKYSMENLEGFIIGRCDWEYMVNCFVIWMKTGFRFIHTPLKEGERTKGIDEPNILITQSGSDLSPLSVVIEKVQDHAGIAFENCQFMNGFEIQEGNTGPLKLTNCGFWGETNTGSLNGSIIVNRGTGQIMITSCHFSTWEDPGRKDIVWNPDAPLIDMHNGSLILTGCLFKDYGVPFKTHILLRENADAAVINGNIVQGGKLHVENRSKADVQIFGNVQAR